MRLQYHQVRGVFAIMPTPSLPNAADCHATFTVDLEEAARAAQSLARDGVDAIMLNGTFGEAAGLTFEEWLLFTTTVVGAVGDSVPVLAGPTALNTRDTIQRARWAADAGASGLLLGRPMWNPLPTDGIVDFYREVAKAVPDLGIVVYNNPSAFKGRIAADAWARLADIPQVVGSKYGMIDDDYFLLTRSVGDRIRMMPIDAHWPRAYGAFPDMALACWSGAASCGPLPVLSLRDALSNGETVLAESLARRMWSSHEANFPRGDVDEFRTYNVQLEKRRIDAAGYMRAGVGRPPYSALPEEHETVAMRSAELWVELVRTCHDSQADAEGPMNEPR